MNIADRKITVVIFALLALGILTFTAFKLLDLTDEGGNLLLEEAEINFVQQEVEKFKENNKVEVDTEPPLILGAQTINLTVGAEKIPGPLMCVDNVDREISYSIVGNYDLNRIGTYNLKRVAIDSSGNKTEFPFTLKINPKVDKQGETTLPDSPSSSPKLTIEEAISRYKTDTTAIGIDVSRWQGNVDWQKVKDSGVEFVMIRLGFQNGFHEGSGLDKYFVENFKGAKAAGLKVGVYYYSYATTIEEAAQQAVFVIHTLKEYDFTPDLPIGYDWETWSKFGSLKMSLNDLNNCAKIFIDIMKEVGYDGYLYSSKYYLENNVWRLPDYKVWLAHYTKETNYEGEYCMWQCSCTGKVPGIAGDVDINVLKMA